jgi:hypothetical protein
MLSRTGGTRRSTNLWAAACALLVASAVLQARAAVEAGNGPLPHFTARTDQPILEYRALRRMHAYNEGQTREAWMTAWTELSNGHMSYQIVAESGSETICGRVLRTVLAREQELVNNGTAARSELTADNYEIIEGGRDENGARFLRLKPRRPDVNLVDGRAVLNENGDMVRVEGRLSRNPSFWTSLVTIVRHYARIGGVRVPVATETTARMRFAGVARLDVVYDYQSINGRTVALSAMSSEVPSRTAGR